MAGAMEAIVTGGVSDDALEAFLVRLREKGETAQEIAAAARVMRAHSLKLSKQFTHLLDTCGTGGDAKHTFNISTVAALVVCAAGVCVAKHGNRSVSGICGSADLLEALGLRIDLPPAEIEKSIETQGFGFFFAPRFHPATRYALPARKRIQGKTLFNLLGPLSNPAGASFQLLGVYEERLVALMAGVLRELGAARALVVHGSDGLDEVTLCGKTRVAELNAGTVKTYEITPRDFGLPEAPTSTLVCGSKEECRQAALQVLKGDRGPKSDVVCLNAGAAFFAAGRSKNIADGVRLAQTTIAGGAALRKLNEIVEFSRGA